MIHRKSTPHHTTSATGPLAEPVLREFLMTRPTAWLVDELITAARSAPLLRARLEQAAGTEPIVDVSGVLERLDRVADFRGFVPYGEAASFAHGIRVELAAVETLRAEGFAAAAIEVLEHAITVIEGAFGFVDDSDGEVGGVLGDAQELHGQACIEAGPEPVELAERLARWALRSNWEVFLDSPGTHAEALGESGLARFREIVDDASVGLSVGDDADDFDDDDSDNGVPTAFTIRYLQEQLAAQRGTDELIDVLAQDLSSAYRFHRIATVLADDCRVEEALVWLERGRNTTFGTWHDDRLDHLAADLHRRAGRFAVATQMVAEGFAASPTVSGYQRLRVFATDSGDWDRRRAEALEVLRAMPVAALPAPGHRSMGEANGHGVLVRVLIEEGDIDGAWAAAQQGGCPSSIWMELAEARGVTHPADAVPVFQRLGANALEGGNRAAYAHGAALIRRAHRFAEAAGLTAESTAWIIDVREQNRRRPALQDEFNRHHLPKVR